MGLLSYKKQQRLWKITIYTLVAIWVSIAVFPTVWMALSSLKPDNEIMKRPPSFLPQNPTISQYKRLFQATSFFTFLKNSLIVTSIVVAITILVCTLGGYSITRFKWKGRRVFARGVLFMYMFPPMLMAIPLFVVLSKIQMINTYPGLVVALLSRATPYCLWLLWGFFMGVPLELEEAAMVDGASRMEALLHVVLPLALPGIAAAAVFAFIIAWDNYTFAFILMTSDSMKTLPVGIASFAQARATEWGLVMSSTSLLSAPAFLFFLLTHKGLIRGFRGAGAVKG